MGEGVVNQLGAGIEGAILNHQRYVEWQLKAARKLWIRYRRIIGGIAGQDQTELVQIAFHRVVQKEASLKSHEHVVSGKIDIVIVVPVRGGNVVVVGIDVIFVSGRIYLLRIQRAAVVLGRHMSAVVVND